MKKNILLLIAVFALSCSCKKNGSSSSSSSYYINATISGTAMTFNNNMVGTQTTVGNQTILEIAGLSGTAGETFSITLNNQGSDSPFVARTYTDAPSAFNILALYGNLPTGYAAGTSVENGARSSGVTINNPLRFIITGIDAQHVQGTFSGDFFQGGDPTTTPKAITNGSFNVKLQ